MQSLVSKYWSAPNDELKDKAVVIVGGGPSAANVDYDKLRGKVEFIAINEAGLTLVPDAFVLFWADKRWLDWNHDRLHLHTGKYKVSRRFDHHNTGHDIKTMKFLPRRMSWWQDNIGGHCGGSSGINLAYLMGCRKIFLVGFDMRPGNFHDKHLLPPLPNQHQGRFIPVLEKMSRQLTMMGCEVFNTNHKSALRCFPFIDIKELYDMDDLTKVERDKYIKIWQRDEYRVVSPGMKEVDRAYDYLEMSRGGLLYDFGSGPCRATKALMDKGLDVLAIDFAPNAREEDVPFLEACLWDLPEDLPIADYGFCCDVMEHIPPEKVDDVLTSIAEQTNIGAYFRIATKPDRMGKLIGKPLHLTVQGTEWWMDKLREHFLIVDLIEDAKRDVVIGVKH